MCALENGLLQIWKNKIPTLKFSNRTGKDEEEDILEKYWANEIINFIEKIAEMPLYNNNMQS